MQMLRVLGTVLADLRYALRTMRKKPGFSLAALLVLALGIGQTTAMFTVLRSVLLKPLAFQDPDRLVQLSRGATSVPFRTFPRTLVQLANERVLPLNQRPLASIQNVTTA